MVQLAWHFYDNAFIKFMKNIDLLIAKYISGNANKDEEAELMAWASLSYANQLTLASARKIWQLSDIPTNQAHTTTILKATKRLLKSWFFWLVIVVLSILCLCGNYGLVEEVTV